MKRHLLNKFARLWHKPSNGTRMIIHRIRSNKEFIEHKTKNAERLEKHLSFINKFVPDKDRGFVIPGYSYTANKQVHFLIDFEHSNHPGQVTWRESVHCPITFFNNRMRATIHMFDLEMEAYPDSKLYVTEQITPIYDYFNSKFASVIGSEYLGDTVPLGSTNKNGVRNENLCSLTFPERSFDVVVCLDVFEHIPSYTLAFEECARVLKKGGKMMWSVPFIPNSAANIIRAEIIEGKISHIHPPEYHGDPLSSDGLLCFQHFGWEMLNQMRSAGFNDAYAVCYDSVEFGYLGGEQFIFVASK